MDVMDAFHMRFGEVIILVSEACRPIIYFRYVLESEFTYQ